MFIRMQTQWVVVNGGFVGLNYQSLDFCLKMYRVKQRREMFESLQIMEAAALTILNKRD